MLEELGWARCTRVTACSLVSARVKSTGNRTARILFNREGKITGLHILTRSLKVSGVIDPYYQGKRFREEIECFFTGEELTHLTLLECWTAPFHE